MGQAARFVLSVLLIGVVVTIGASVIGWWMAPSRRTARALRRLLHIRPDAAAVSPESGRGLAISAAYGGLAVVRFGGDPGLAYPLDVAIGAELMLDGEVKARAYRGEGRRPLDRIEPGAAGRVTLRLLLDDQQDPAFEVDLWTPADRPHPGHTPERALQEARAVYARLEAAVLRPASGIAIGR